MRHTRLHWVRADLGARARLLRGAACAFLLVCAGAAATARAQTPDLDRLRLQLERTDAVLERARDVVHVSGNPRAARQLGFAVHLQRLAWEEARAIRLRRANDLTVQARDHAQRAIGLASKQRDLELRAQRAIEEAGRFLDQARERAGDAPPERVLRLLSLAASRLEQAGEFFHEQKFAVALDVALSVRHMLEDLGPGRPVRQVEHLIESTRQLLERAAPDIESADNSAAVALLERARNLLRGAETSQLDGNLAAAGAQAQQARDLLLRAMRMTERPPDPANVERVLAETAAYVDGLARRVRASGGADAITLMDRALEHLQRARDLGLRGDLRQALAETRVARNLARRASQLAGIDEM